jgi:predicted RecA/RadA family phage recombinase
MSSFIQPGAVLTLAAPYAVTPGAGAKVGAIFGVSTGTYALGETGEFNTEGVHALAKVSAQAWTVGALIYWDNTAKLVTTVSTSNMLIGFATEAAANPSPTGRVKLVHSLI